MPEYEKNCVLEYVGGNEDKLLFVNPQDTSLNSILNVIVIKINFFIKIKCLFLERNFSC